MERLAALRDGMDREHMEQVLQSQGYALIKQRLQGVLTGELEALARDLSPEDTAKKRGLIAGLRLALSLPQQMLGEYRVKPGQ